MQDRTAIAREHFASLVALHGTTKAHKMIGITSESGARLLANLTVHNGTVALVLEHRRERLETMRTISTPAAEPKPAAT